MNENSDLKDERHTLKCELKYMQHKTKYNNKEQEKEEKRQS
jgi:hypothetical protein